MVWVGDKMVGVKVWSKSVVWCNIGVPYIFLVGNGEKNICAHTTTHTNIKFLIYDYIRN